MAIALDPRYVVELRPARPARPAPRATGRPAARPSEVVYRRRRTVAAVVVAVALCVTVVGGRSVLADDPRADIGAGASAVVAADQAPAVYLVQPGDTMWAIAERFAGDVAIGSYVDALIDANGGAAIQAGQQLTLP